MHLDFIVMLVTYEKFGMKICIFPVISQVTMPLKVCSFIFDISNGHGTYMKLQRRRFNLRTSLSDIMERKVLLKWFSETYWIIYTQRRNSTHDLRVDPC